MLIACLCYCNVEHSPQREAERFESAIVTTSSEGGKQGIVLLPGVKDIIDNVCCH